MHDDPDAINLPASLTGSAENDHVPTTVGIHLLIVIRQTRGKILVQSAFRLLLPEYLEMELELSTLYRGSLLHGRMCLLFVNYRVCTKYKSVSLVCIHICSLSY